MEEFSVSAAVQDGTVVVTVTGDVDLATADRLDEMVTPFLQQSRAVVVDCSGILFLDSAGIRVLLDLSRRAGESGPGLTLVSVGDPVARVLDLAGVRSMFSVREAVPEPPLS